MTESPDTNRKNERKQIQLKQETVEKISVEMLSSWWNPGLQELDSNIKWQTMMAESTSDCQLPADFWVTRGIQSDTFRSMTANFVRSMFCLLILNFIHCPSQTGQFPQKAGRISFSFPVIFTCNRQQVFLACWVYIYKHQTDCTFFFSLRGIRSLRVVCRIFSCNY